MAPTTCRLRCGKHNYSNVMKEQERKEKAIREYNEVYPKYKAEFDRGAEAISKWVEHQDEPKKSKLYKAILDETVANCNAMAERFIEVCGAAYYHGHAVDKDLWAHAVKALYYLRKKI